MAFGLKSKGTAALGQNLKEIYHLRDLAVHPSGGLEAAILHPELNVGVEWRFAYFRYANAETLVRTAERMLAELVTTGRPKNQAVQQYANALRLRLEELGIKQELAAPT
jgi:hypothetical protein